MTIIRRLLVPAAALTLTACTAQPPAPPAAERSYVTPRTAADATLPPFSGATRIGDTLYLSGHIGIDANQQVPDTAEGEAAAVLDQFKATLEHAGMTMDDLVYVQIFCSDVSHYAAFNTVYRTYFEREFPARAFIGSGPLLFSARFEVQGIAVKRTEG
jgi:2-iminobutanoate/2-iminopropanoate deaminase